MRGGAVGASPAGLSPLRVAAVLLLVAAAALWVHGTFRLHIEPGDEGVTLLGASRLAAGEVPHRDFFEIVPPGSLVPVALAFRLLGASVEVGRAVTVLYAFLLLLLVNRVARRLGAAPLPRLAACALLVPFGVWTWPMPSHHWLADLLLLGSLDLLLEEGGRWRTPLSAALAAWAGLTLQDQGLYWLVAASALWIWAERGTAGAWRRPLAWAGWVAAFGSAAVLPLALLAGPKALLQQWVLFPASRYRGVPGNEGALGFGWRESLEAVSSAVGPAQVGYSVAQFLFHAVLLLAPLTALYLLRVARRDPERRRGVLLLLAAQAAFYGACLHRWSALNMAWAFPAGLLGLTLLLSEGADSPRRAVAAVGRGGAWALLVLAAVALLAGAVVVGQAERFTVAGPGGRLESLEAGKARALGEVLQAVERHVPPGAPVFFSGYFPLLNVLSARPNPTRYNIFLCPEYHTFAQAEAVSDDLAALPEAYVVLPFPVRPQSPFDAEVTRSYRRLWTGSRFALFVRRQAPPAGERP